MTEQPAAPYLDAVIGYGTRGPGRFHVPGHKGGPGADPGLRYALGDRALGIDIPQDIHGVEIGRGRLLGHPWPAVRMSSARTKPSRSPSSTRWASPTSNEVRWSLTIVYGCRT